MDENIPPDKFTGKLFPGRICSEVENNDYLSGVNASSKSNLKKANRAADCSLKLTFISCLMQYGLLLTGVGLYSKSLSGSVFQNYFLQMAAYRAVPCP